MKKLTDMFADTKTLGVDMFLLDDGWFGNKYPRSGDKSGLGDWQATKTKLPNGIGFNSRSTENRSEIWYLD